MSGTSRIPKILLIDSNVYFSKRLSDALKREGFQVLASTQPTFALTTLEYDTPTAVVCATNMRDMGALEIATIIKADPKNANLPIIALGDGSQRALMEAFQAGCDDYIDRQRQPAVIASHIRNIIISKSEGFQPTQMLAQADTSLSGSLTHHDLPGVLQMLGQARQTGALHINAGATDAVLFFDAGNINHAECGSLFGDEAVIHIVKSCIRGEGVYKFVYGATTPRTTVLRSATDLMLDAMREYDESALDSPEESEPGSLNLAEMLAANPVAGESAQETPVAAQSTEAQSTEAQSTEPQPTEVQSTEVQSTEIQSTELSTEFQPTETPPEEKPIHHEPQAEFVEHTELVEHAEPVASLEQNSIIAEPENSDGSTAPAPILHEESLLRTPSSDFQIVSSEEDSATGYTEASPEPNEEHSEASIVLGQEEQVSLLEKILAELANHHIVEEQSPSDLADKEAQ
jgi:CheY-like chemotaxis protein